MAYKARFNKKGNTKLGLIFSYSKLFGAKEYDYNGEKIAGTCGKVCKNCGCDGPCYVAKSYRYPSVVLSHARNTKAFRTDLFSAFRDLDAQIARARKKPAAVRIDQSGELEAPAEFSAWIMLAGKYPDIAFYVYTKRFDIITPILLELAEKNEIPNNFFVLCSVWHSSGVKEYKALSGLACVKAFVYYDGYDYEKEGLTACTWCKAYDEKGKMNHAITCERCGKCFKGGEKRKVIFCNEH